MSQAIDVLNTYGLLTLLVLLNAVGVVLVALQLPGTWLILLLTTLAAWYHDWAYISLGTLIALAVVAVVGEIVEAVAGAAGARKAGGSRRGALLALALSIVGAIVGTPFFPVLGTILGACVGALVGAVLGDLWAGRAWKMAWEAGQGAAWGKLWGTLGKIALAGLMWLMVLAAIFWP